MSDDEILRKAIILAVDRGWKYWSKGQKTHYIYKYATNNTGIQEYLDSNNNPNFNYRSIVYDVNFSRSYWGGDYKTRLQEMIVSENPLTYLKKGFGND